MSSGILVQIAQLRDLLNTMELDLGLDKLSPNERDVLLAFYANAWNDAEDRSVCTTDVVRDHPTLRRISQPTFHRTLKKLVDKGLVLQNRALGAGLYQLPNQ
ncbi:hypothetical protein DS909_19330 [Phaeobacter gallaeciensis]|jgi:DNA-binding MarR family transcriptional regulator|uniref:MarR family transcriptional regulator n=6 Tax=Roseobacteraceae TaxID=2854170 RepID=A0A366WKS0_9RHOB|nr:MULTISPECIES: hypothetical protein [Roseobacteraceae]MBT3141732.1 hypothetical protein [Falsiruegeria litorea]MBT8170090.1 hypothetical protein [Falsiruegeria litorea]RBW50718.1 hypothetical protein DS909_19330 [Phaeobacter gallaeciensis]